MNNSSRIFTAFLVGAAVGAVLGILFAPMSGDELRENISNRAGDITDKVKRKAEEGMNYARNLKSKASGKINELLNKQEEEGSDYVT